MGRTFFREHFGPDAESPVLWLPDVFGYAWTLPQLIKQAGLDYFFTIKIGWNQYNRLPYDSFWWQGLDGTRVLTHFSTTPDAGGCGAAPTTPAPRPSRCCGTWTNFQQKELQQSPADGLRLRRWRRRPDARDAREHARDGQLSRPRRACARAASATSSASWSTTAGDRLPVWNGELYLELHRGTYTTQSRNKRANRKSEFLLHDAEFLATLAAQLDPATRIPARALHQAWELVCLNQFHDIIPGSSIGPVYAESQQQYAADPRDGEAGARRGAARYRRTGPAATCCSSTRPSSRAATWPSGPASCRADCSSPDGQRRS